MRPCGDCQLCCTLMAVATLGKGMNERCRHQCAAGCAIYPQRPYACARFDCLWRQGLGGEAERPDLVHAVCSITREGFVVHEDPGFEGEGRRALVRFLKAAARTAPVVIYVGDRRL